MINNVHILYSSYSHSFMVINRGSMLMLVFFWDFFDLRICITCIYTLHTTILSDDHVTIAPASCLFDF